MQADRISAAVTAALLALGISGTAVAQDAEAPLRVALLTPGLTNDGSFNQAAAEAVEKLAAEGLIEVEIRERMADPATSEPVIREYAARGYDLVIGHGIEISEPVLTVAAEFPDIHFAASGGPDLAERLLPNVNGWTYDFAQQGYLAGWVAGRIPGVTTVGAVGGPQLPFILAAHAGFAAGLAETNPDARIVETFTGSFDDVQRAVEATRGLIGQGAQLVWTSGDGIGNGVAAAAADAGVFTLGVTGDAGGLASQVNVASVELDMYPTFRTYVDSVRNDTFGGTFFTSGLSNRGLVLTAINPVAPGLPDTLGAEVQDLIDELSSGAKSLPNFYE